MRRRLICVTVRPEQYPYTAPDSLNVLRHSRCAGVSFGALTTYLATRCGRPDAIAKRIGLGSHFIANLSSLNNSLARERTNQRSGLLRI